MHILLNWLVQGGVVALAAAAVLRLIPRSRTRARYCFAWAACIIVAGLPAVAHLAAPVTPVTSLMPATDATFVPLDPMVSLPPAWWTSTVLAVVLWTIWSVTCAVRVGASALAVRGMKRRCRQSPRDMLAGLHYWSQVRTSGRRTRVMLSTEVRFAAVIGCGAPVIALAPSLLEDLTDDDIDRVVIHEWAHVQRYDDVTRFLQRIVFVVAGWHPAVWWLTRQMEREREVACDEVVIAVTGSAKAYARCLATLAALTVSVRPHPALGVSASGLRGRIVRILATHHIEPPRPWRAVAVCASLALVGLAVVVCNLPIAEPASAEGNLFTSVGSGRPTAGGTPVSAIVPLRVRAAPEETSMTPGRLPAEGRVRSAKRENAPPRHSLVAGQTVDPPATTALIAAPSRTLDSYLALPTSGLVTASAAAGDTESHFSAPLTPPADQAARAPWVAAADTGVAIGQASRNASVATAGFFSRFGKKIARSF